MNDVKSDAHRLVLEALDEFTQYAKKEGVRSMLVVAITDDEEMVCQTAGALSPVKALGMLEAAKSRWIGAMVGAHLDTGDEDDEPPALFGSTKNVKAS